MHVGRRSRFERGCWNTHHPGESGAANAIARRDRHRARAYHDRGSGNRYSAAAKLD